MPTVSKSLDREQDAVRREAMPLSRELEAYAARFNPRVRRDVRQLMRADGRFADLARVFPGAAVAIVTSTAPVAERRVALDLVRQGAALKTVARALSLPLWLRRLPPEAFTGTIHDVPQGETFARRIAARLPAAGPEAAFWLASICYGAKTVHEDFALWLAEQPLFHDSGDPARLYPVLSAYAWYSGNLHTPAGGLIVVPWRPQLAFDTAVCAAKSWFNRMRLILLLEARALVDTWLERGSAMGYSFEPLVDATALLAEAQGMQNCADQYADRPVRDRCRLFSVRRGSTRIATLEIGPHSREAGVLAITQLKARHNMPASLEIWQAAFAWMSGQGRLKRLPSLVVPEQSLDLSRWRQLMAPYRAAKSGAPWLIDSISPEAMGSLDAGMADLARRGGVTSWLFT